MTALAPAPLFENRAAIIEQDRLALVRCHCPTCLRLDREHPGEGYQLTFVAYRFLDAAGWPGR